MALAAELHRQPTDQEVLNKTRADPQEFGRTVRDAAIAARRQVSLSRPLYENDTGRMEQLSAAFAVTDPHPAAAMAAREMIDRAMEGFNRTERLAVLLYHAGHSMREAGAVIGVTESMVSQILKNLRDRLRAKSIATPNCPLLDRIGLLRVAALTAFNRRKCRCQPGETGI